MAHEVSLQQINKHNYEKFQIYPYLGYALREHSRFCTVCKQWWQPLFGRWFSTYQGHQKLFTHLHRLQPHHHFYDVKGVDNTTLNGFTFGYTKGISLSKNLPIFLELGARFNFGFKSENLSDEDDDDYYSTRLSYDYDDDYDEDEEETCKTTTASLVVPINVAYKLTFAGGDFSVSPFLGITLKGNILGKEKYEYGDEKETIDFFDKKDMEGKEYTWNRFQAGWQIGANLDYKALSLGFHYGSDFNEIAKKTNTKNWAINIGYKF